MVNATMDKNATQTDKSSTYAKEITPVQVALRIRPLCRQDKSQPRYAHSTESSVIKVHGNTVTMIQSQKTFQFDHVFDCTSTQQQLFDQMASSLLDRFLSGFNATILAYGQTSSGKTYTMGTAASQTSSDDQGIIPRAAQALFDRLYAKPTNTTKARPSSTVFGTFPTGIRTPRPSQSAAARLRPVSMIVPPRSGSSPVLSGRAPRYTIKVSFVEIYNEELVDLLNTAPPAERGSVTIQEDSKGRIHWTGVKEFVVSNAQDVLKYLELGTANRATGATDMNRQSSRSHAIFTITLKQEKWVANNHGNSGNRTAESETRPRTANGNPSHIGRRISTLNVKAMVGQMERQAKSQRTSDSEQGSWITLHSKFHFVDLAGSERLKRTAAKGDRRKEGISINSGLLALGNVISALTDPAKKSMHINYRDSKLTRLLQDSLGGTAATAMIACASPAVADVVETTNTLNYISRARHIKNKTERQEVEAWQTNDDPSFLRAHITKLKNEVRQLKQTQTTVADKTQKTSVASSSHSSSSSVSSEAERQQTSTYASSSARTTITIPDPTDLEAQQTLVADLRRQIEELNNEVTVTRERNHYVEKELSAAAAASQNGRAVDLAMYEKTIAQLESELAMARAALQQSDQRLSELESSHRANVNTLDSVKVCLASSQEHLPHVDPSGAEPGQLVDAASLHNASASDKQTLRELRLEMEQLRSLSSLSDTNTDPSEQSISPISHRKSVESDNTSQHPEDSILIKALESQMADKQRQIEALEQKLADMEAVRDELYALRDTQVSKINELALALTTAKEDYETAKQQLASESERRQALQLQSEHVIQALESKVRDLAAKYEQTHLDLKASREKSDQMQKHMWAQEQGTQMTVGRHLQNLEKVKMELHQLRMIESKQHAMIQRLEIKMAEMDTLTANLRQQLSQRDDEILLLEKENDQKEATIRDLEDKVKQILRNVDGMQSDRKQLDLTISYVDKTLQRHGAKTDKSMDVLDELCARYSAQAGELEKKQRLVESLREEKEALTSELQQVTERQAASETRALQLEDELSAAKGALDEQLALVKKLKQDQLEATIELQRTKALESRVTELDQELLTLERDRQAAATALQDKQHQIEQLNEALSKQTAKTEELQVSVRQLEEAVEAERAIIRANDMSGRVAELEAQLQAVKADKEQEQEELHQRFDRAVADLESTQKKNRDQERVIQALEASLSLVQSRLDEAIAQRSLSGASTGNDGEAPHAFTTAPNAPPVAMHELSAKYKQQTGAPGDNALIEKVAYLVEDNAQLVSQVHDLEGQLVLQRNKMALETKNLELEVMRLSATNHRLEKELEKMVPQRSSSLTHGSNRDSAHATSPPQSPRMVSPTPGSLHYNMLQRESSSNSASRFRAMILREDLDQDQKRISSSSIRSDQRSIRTRTLSAASVIPPPSAPPSNPLPPVPSALPTIPSSPSPSPSSSSSPPPPPAQSPPLPPVRSTSSPHLQRHNSITTITTSDITLDSENLTSERYEKIIRALQRKIHASETDVRAHQDVISRLETQLSKSENAVREVKKQLDLVSREKQATSLEIQNLRTQVTQVRSQYESESARILEQCKTLQEQLDNERKQKQKAERARQILENRMEEVMSKKNKFMCF